MVPLSILDLSPVTTATPPAQALRNTLDLARFADTLGYTRYWLPPHHKLPKIHSPAARHHDRAGRRDHEEHARGFGRGHAAQPCAADGDGALQGAGGALPR